MNKRIYLFDSSADFDERVGFGAPVDVLPLRVYINDKEYKDKVDITNDEFYSYCQSGAKLRTSQPAQNDIEGKLLKYSKDYETVYVVTISSKLSGTYDSVRNCVKNHKLKNVHVLDSKSASAKTTYVLYRTIHEAENGKVVNQEMVDTFIKESLLIFTVSSLEYLERGGRIGKAKALLGKLLKIKPILSTDEEGYTVSVDTARTMENCIEKMRKLIYTFTEKVANPVVIAGYGVESMKSYLQKLIEGFKIHSMVRIGSAITAHVGPEVFGVAIGRGF
uniref:DegV family protein n=1 Tax=Fervidobacterium thailandense TaxID=1008305 RepID=A0A7C5RJA3_9BACT